MDKVIMNKSDIDLLLKWRDEHVDLVRKMTCPLKAIEIQIEDSPNKIKGIRNGNDLKLYLNQNGQPVGYIEIEILPNGNSMIVSNKSHIHEENIQSMLTIYASLMALMAYYQPPKPEVTDEPKSSNRKPSKPKSGKKHGKKPDIVYIMHNHSGRVFVAPKGSHSSPSHAFSVRGHFRHYKNGKTVWIEQYQKGTGKTARDKTYYLQKKTKEANHDKCKNRQKER